MKRTHGILLAACIFFSAVLSWAQEQQSTVLPVGSATVADYKGEVALHAPDGTTLAADRGMTLAAQTAIETGKGSILLSLQDGSQVLVKPHSHVVLKSPDQAPGYWLELNIGKLVAKVKKRLGNSPSFRMGTPTAVITVRGTRFEVEVDKKQRTRVEVYEGIVEVRGMGVTVGTGVMLRPGYLTHVQANRDPEKPQEIEREGLGPGPGSIGDDRPGAGRVGSEGQQSGSGERENEPN